ncbi:MAG TPA: transporter substrate-binding domain-containing protein, partial [Novosphingobium sp.]|nr:transporter substrate-binding domain-containing protein [Novosphingobium sp.]
MALLATNAPAAHAQAPVIRFGLTGDYPPFAQRHADSSLTGADLDMARKVAQSMGARAEFVLTSWTSLAADFAARRFDVAIGGLTVTPERAALGTFSLTMLDDGKRPLALCRNRHRFARLADIDQPGTRVQINRGPAIAQLARQWLQRATIITNPDDDTLTRRLLDGSVDVWITDGVVVDRMARQSGG